MAQRVRSGRGSAVLSYLAIVNPVAGGGRGTKLLEKARGRYELEVHPTRARGDGIRLGKELSPDGHQGLMVFGGDGTVHEVVQGLMQRPENERLPLALMTGGTGDALARDLGIEDPQVLDAALESRSQRRIDLARTEIDDRTAYCFSVVGWGAFARINRLAERLRFARGKRYDLAAALELMRPGSIAGAGVEWDEGLPDPLLGVACMTRFTGKGMHIAPDSRLDDGLADVVEIERHSRFGLARLLTRVFDGSHVNSERVRVTRHASLSLTLQPGSHVVLDGEAVPATKLRLEVVPRILEVFAPPQPDGQ